MHIDYNIDKQMFWRWGFPYITPFLGGKWEAHLSQVKALRPWRSMRDVPCATTQRRGRA